jgi:putative membrane protein
MSGQALPDATRQLARYGLLLISAGGCMRNGREPFDRSGWKGLVAGLVGGLFASWMMNQYESAAQKISQSWEENNPRRSSKQQQESQFHGGRDESQSQDEDSTMKMAELLSGKVLHRQLSEDEKKKAGPMVHYAYGALAAGLYGLAAEVVPAVTKGEGTLYATALFVGGDEIAVPALGLAKSPLDYPLSSHANALAAHLVYGVTTELGRRAVRAIL